MFSIPLIFFGDTIIGMVYSVQPEWYKAVAENKMTVFMMVWILNSVAQNMCATGAFEITLDGKMLFSKIKEGRMPTIDEVVNLLSRRGLKMN